MITCADNMTAVMERSSLLPGASLPDHDFSFGRGRFKASPFLPPDNTSPGNSSWSQKRQPPQPLTTDAESTRAPERPQYSRKRPRLTTRSVQEDSISSARSTHLDAPSPSPLVNTTYRIAGGLDTPTALASQREDDVHEFDYEIDCRPNRYRCQTPRPASDSYFPQTPELAQGAGNKRRLSPSATPMKGWGQTVWALTGGFAGKVFNFCWNNTFNGFHAGGGIGYRLNIGTPAVVSGGWADVDSRDDPFHNDYYGQARRGARDSTPVPGGFPDDAPEFIEDYMSKLTVEQPKSGHTPSATKVRAESPVMSRYNSWVVVDEAAGSRSREPSPARKKSRASTANLYAAPPSPGARHSNHTLSRPRHIPRPSTGRSSASYASPRTSLNPHHQSRRSISSMPISEFAQNERKFEKSPRQSEHCSTTRTGRPSHASPRRKSSISSPKQQQSPEVRKFETKMRKKEARQEQTINRFNDRLQAMIQEGQAALGSRIEVEMGDDDDDDCDLDEGYFDAESKPSGEASPRVRLWS
jgi:hypothetical protein